MKLNPVVASYTDRNKVIQALTADLLEVVVQVAQGPVQMGSINHAVLQELLDMHIVKMEGEVVRLNTAVFSAKDLVSVVDVASTLGRGLAERLLMVAHMLPPSSPEIRNFLAGVVGVGQGVSKLLREEKLVVDWKNYGGKYAATKVDFDEVCTEASLLVPDLQNKSLSRGYRYTAVFIGPMDRMPGELSHVKLAREAEEAGLFVNGKPKDNVVTRDVYESYVPVIARLTEISYDFYTEHIEIGRAHV